MWLTAVRTSGTHVSLDTRRFFPFVYVKRVQAKRQINQVQTMPKVDPGKAESLLGSTRAGRLSCNSHATVSRNSQLKSRSLDLRNLTGLLLKLSCLTPASCGHFFAFDDISFNMPDYENRPLLLWPLRSQNSNQVPIENLMTKCVANSHWQQLILKV